MMMSLAVFVIITFCKEVLWINPGGQLSPTQPLTHSSPVGCRRESDGQKIDGLRQKQFNKENKSCMYKQRKMRDSFSTSHHQASV